MGIDMENTAVGKKRCFCIKYYNEKDYIAKDSGKNINLCPRPTSHMLLTSRRLSFWLAVEMSVSVALADKMRLFLC